MRPTSETVETIDVALYRSDPVARRRADAVLAELGYQTGRVVELRITAHTISVDVVLRPGVIRTDTWPVPSRKREEHSNDIDPA